MIEKYPDESVVFDLDCSEILPATELATGTPVMSFLPALTGGDALTFGAAVVSTADTTYEDGRVVPAGQLIQVRISGGTSSATQSRRTYAVSAKFNTTAGNVMVARALLDVLNPAPPSA